MVRLRVKELLEERGITKYRLHQQMQRKNGISYGNFNSMVENKTSSIRYSNLDLLCEILECEVGELFERVEGEEGTEEA